VNALEVRGISKNYPLGGSQWSRFRRALAAGRNKETAASGEGVWALREISFHVERGAAFGIVGANGSGKSTLLKIIAGIMRPTSGTVEVNGRLSALLELGSGFSPAFTGRQNVYLNASILGLSREETDERFEAIERFASIGDFIDQPIRTYSTGMVLRLAFAVVAHVDPEIVIVDEALAVGDIAFRQRCMRRIHELRAAGTTILFVSHETGDVKALCERCLWLDSGRTRLIGETDAVLGGYLSETVRREEASDRQFGSRIPSPSPARAPEMAKPITGRHRYGSGAAEIVGAELDESEAESAGSMTLRVTFRVISTLANPIAGFLVRNEKGETIFGANSLHENFPMPAMATGDVHTVDFRWAAPPIASGRYCVSLAVSDGTLGDFGVCDYVEDALSFDVDGGNVVGYLKLRCAAVLTTRG
jgi:ABC-type polysaccharide/polyol phosphate transport system ATPase subunit